MATSGDDGIKKKFFMDLKGLFSQTQEVDESNHSDTYSDESKVVQLDYDDEGIGNSNMLHPIRPHADDCSFFLRTGTCKFGTTCVFNHPVLTKNSVDLGKSNENGVQSSYRNSCPIPCKFYLSGICKYGDSCRFNHSISEAEKSPGLNVFGFPKRLGKKNCAFYIRTGMCGYGESCRFHHPDPFFIVPELYSSVVTGESMDDYQEASEIAPRFSESTLSHLSRPLMTPSSFVYLHQNFVLGGNKAPCNQEVRSSSALPAANVETFEDRFYGPPKREPCVLNDVGLPIRPGKNLCRNYERLGLCKFGHTCAYDHPNKHIPKHGSTSEFPSGEAYPYNIPQKACC